MPLLKGPTPEVVSENIRRELRAGKSHAQAVAIALNAARKPKKRKRKKRSCCVACKLGQKCRSVILTDERGRPIEKPARKDYTSDLDYMNAFYAYKDKIAAEANRGFNKGIRSLQK